MFLSCRKHLTFSAKPTSKNAADVVVATVAGNELRDGLSKAERLPGTLSKIKRALSAADLFSLTAYVKQLAMASDKPKYFFVTHLHGLHISFRSQCLRRMTKTSMIHFFQ